MGRAVYFSSALVGEYGIILRRGLRCGLDIKVVIPYLILSGGVRGFLEFTKQAFGASERLIVPTDDGKIMHGELIIGDSLIEFADANDQFPARPMALHHYVRDVDETYSRALAAGATSLYGVTDQGYGDREGGLRDAFGNIWFIATHKATAISPRVCVTLRHTSTWTVPSA